MTVYWAFIVLAELSPAASFLPCSLWCCHLGVSLSANQCTGECADNDDGTAESASFVSCRQSMLHSYSEGWYGEYNFPVSFQLGVLWDPSMLLVCLLESSESGVCRSGECATTFSTAWSFSPFTLLYCSWYWFARQAETSLRSFWLKWWDRSCH